MIVCLCKIRYAKFVVRSLFLSLGSNSSFDTLVLLDGWVVFDGSPSVAHVPQIALYKDVIVVLPISKRCISHP